MPTYVEKITASDLTLFFDTATRVLSAGAGSDTTFAISPPNGGGAEWHYFVTNAGIPNSDSWPSGGTQTVEVEVTSGDRKIECQARVARCDASGTILQSGAMTAFQKMGVPRTFSPVAPTWTGGEEACGNRYIILLVFVNTAASGFHSITVAVGATPDNDIVSTITEDAGSCGGAPPPTAIQRVTIF